MPNTRKKQTSLKQPALGHYAVFGASGMLGSHALRALANRQGIKVTAIHNTRPVRIQADNITCIQADLVHFEQCQAVLRDVDYALIFVGMLSTASVLARDPVTPILSTLRMTLNILEAIYKTNDVKHTVWISSTTAYPDKDQELDEDAVFDGQPPSPWHMLGWTIRYLEIVCQSLAERFNRKMAFTSLRSTMAYGEFDHFDEKIAHFLPSMIRRVVNRERPIEIWGDGNTTRDLIYAGDVIEAVWSALERPAGYEAFNIAYGQSFSVNEVLQKICAIDNFTDAEVAHVPGKPTSMAHRRFATAKARDVLNFKPSTFLEEGLRRTIAWYRTETDGTVRK